MAPVHATNSARPIRWSARLARANQSCC